VRFVRVADGWHLVDDAGKLIAALKTEIELLALMAFCERFLNDPKRLPEHFTVERDGTRYTVTPLGGAGENLAIVVAGGGASRTVETAFVLAPEDLPPQDQP
jgi:hypothetical protein